MINEPIVPGPLSQGAKVSPCQNSSHRPCPALFNPFHVLNPFSCYVTALLLVLLASSGCSIRHYALNKASDALAQSGTTFASDDDPDLIKAAAPFSLKLMES